MSFWSWFKRKKKPSPEITAPAKKTIVYPSIGSREIDREYYRRVDENDRYRSGTDDAVMNTVLTAMVVNSWNEEPVRDCSPPSSYDDSSRHSPVSWDNGASSPSYESSSSSCDYSSSSSSYDSGSSSSSDSY